MHQQSCKNVEGGGELDALQTDVASQLQAEPCHRISDQWEVNEGVEQALLCPDACC